MGDSRGRDCRRRGQRTEGGQEIRKRERQDKEKSEKRLEKH